MDVKEKRDAGLPEIWSINVQILSCNNNLTLLKKIAKFILWKFSEYSLTEW